MPEVERHGGGQTREAVLIRRHVRGGRSPVHPERPVLPRPAQDGAVGGAGGDGPQYVNISFYAGLHRGAGDTTETSGASL